MLTNLYFNAYVDVAQFCKTRSYEFESMTSAEVNEVARLYQQFLSNEQVLSVEDTFYLKKAVGLMRTRFCWYESKKTLNALDQCINEKTASRILRGELSSPPFLARFFDPTYASRHASQNKRERLFMTLNEKVEVMKSLGGERCAAVRNDGLKVDGMHFKVDRFVESVKNHGGKFVTLSVGSKDSSSIEFDKKSYKKVGSLLYKMGFFEAGWTKVTHGDKIYLIKKEDREIFNHSELRINEREMLLSLERPTVLVSAGLEGNYEFYLKQVASLVMNGVDVRLYNYSGQGESEGQLSDDSRIEDIQAVYNDLLANGVNENSILLEGICVGAGPTSALAAQLTCEGKEANVILVKSPSNFLNVVKLLIPRFLHFIISWFKNNIPSYDVAHNLKIVEGNKLLIIPTEDVYCNGGEMARNVHALFLKHKESNSFEVLQARGKHDFSWHRSNSVKGGVFKWIEEVSYKQSFQLQAVL